MNPNYYKSETPHAMNTLFKMLFALILVSGVSFSSSAQNEDDLIRFLQGGQEDGGKLITAYINPFVEGFSYALNGGWFHTAKVHKLGGFNFNFSVTPVFIPKSKDYFDPQTLNFNTIVGFTNDSKSGANAPTFIGPKDQTTYYLNFDLDGDGNVNSEGNLIDADDTFNGPQGLGIRDAIKMAPTGAPMAQVGIGLIKGTDLSFRFIPKVELGNTEVNLIGFGLRHDVKQHIPGIKMLPFDLSVMAGFTTFKGVTDLSGDYPGSNQEAVYKFNAFLLQALVSKKLAFVTFFGGVGYNGVKTTAKINGTYTFFSGEPGEFTTSPNPYSGTFKNNSMRMDVGMRINILAFYLYGAYSLQEYSAVTAGLGFTFR
jgi:hypothetical protein